LTFPSKSQPELRYAIIEALTVIYIRAVVLVLVLVLVLVCCFTPPGSG
jgi:hypothetical protein